MTVPPNYHVTLTADTTLFHRILFWKDQAPVPLSGVTGKVNLHRHFFSPELGNERTLIVWLPPSYSTTNRHYPVLYLHDGQNVFNPATSFAGQDWKLDETAKRLIQDGLIQEIIMVGIYNTPERNAEYNPELKGRQYSQFLVQTVKPFIDSTYRTLPDPPHTAVMGSSMGGLIAFYLGWEYPQVFSMVACLSPAFLISHSRIVKQVTRYQGPKKGLKIILFNGTKGLEADLKPAVLQMDNALRKQKFTPGADYLFKLIPGADHNEQAWADQAPDVLLFFFGS